MVRLEKGTLELAVLGGKVEGLLQVVDFKGQLVDLFLMGLLLFEKDFLVDLGVGGEVALLEHFCVFISIII